MFVGLVRVAGWLGRLVRPSENIWFREETRKTIICTKNHDICCNPCNVNVNDHACDTHMNRKVKVLQYSAIGMLRNELFSFHTVYSRDKLPHSVSFQQSLCCLDRYDLLFNRGLTCKLTLVEASAPLGKWI